MNSEEISSVNSLLINGNLVSKGISHFYNKVNIESTLEINKKIKLSDFVIQPNKNGDFLQIDCLDIGLNSLNLNTLSLKSKDGYSSLQLGNSFKIETNPKDNLYIYGNPGTILSINKRGQIGINTTSQTSNLEIFGRLKCDDFNCTNVTCNNITITDNLSINKNLEINKENCVIFKASGGLSPPKLGSRSTGSKIVLYPAISDKLSDYAIGLENGNMWFSVPMSKSNFGWKFYSSDKTVFSISGDGSVDCNGPITSGGLQVPTFDSGRIQTDDLVANWFKIKDLVFVEINVLSTTINDDLILTLPFPITNKLSLIHPNVKLSDSNNSTVTINTKSYLSFTYK